MSPEIKHWLEISDTEKHYDENRDKLIALGWTKENIVYQYNDEGYRSEDFFGNNHCALFLGCSFTDGMGLNLEATWGHIVAKYLGFRYCSVARAGYSNDACFRELNRWLPVINPKMVFMLAPPSHRFEAKIYSEPAIQFQIQNLLNPPESKPKEFFDCIPYALLWNAFEENYILNRLKNYLAIKQLCSENNTPFYYLQSEQFPYIEGDRARDLQHPGRIWQKNIADKFIQLINDTRTDNG